MPTLPQQAPASELSKTLTFRVTPDLWERVGVIARQQKTSIQALCTGAIESRLEELAKKPVAA